MKNRIGIISRPRKNWYAQDADERKALKITAGLVGILTILYVIALCLFTV
jgi:hypothetical protein